MFLKIQKPCYNVFTPYAVQCLESADLSCFNIVVRQC